MIDLRNTCILVKTKEENEMLLKEAEKQGFHWRSEGNCEPLQRQHFPDILNFFTNKDITCVAYINQDFTFYEASKLLGTKEMTAREFAEWYSDVSDCCERNCTECVLHQRNTKCHKFLCNISNWENNTDELSEIAKSGRFTIQSPEEKAIKNIEKLIRIPDHEITDEIKESLKPALEKLEEIKC